MESEEKHHGQTYGVMEDKSDVAFVNTETKSYKWTKGMRSKFDRRRANLNTYGSADNLDGPLAPCNVQLHLLGFSDGGIVHSCLYFTTADLSQLLSHRLAVL